MGKNRLIYLTVLQVQRHSICMAQLMTWHAVWQTVAYCVLSCCMADGGILCPVLFYGRRWHTVTCHVVWQTVAYCVLSCCMADSNILIWTKHLIWSQKQRKRHRTHHFLRRPTFPNPLKILSPPNSITLQHKPITMDFGQRHWSHSKTCTLIVG